MAETSAGMPSAIFGKNLLIGIRSDDVRRLQNLLASDKEIYPEGFVSGLYGPLTKKAVGKFQLKYGVVSSSKAPGCRQVVPAVSGLSKVRQWVDRPPWRCPRDPF